MGGFPYHTDPALPTFGGGDHGWDGTQWRKLPLLWGYSGRWAEAKQNLDASAGQNDIDSTTVPAGEVWVLQALSAFNMNTDTRIEFLIAGSGVTVRIETFSAPGVATAVVKRPGDVTLGPGDVARARFLSCTLNDDIYAQFWGYKMAIAE